MRCDVAIVGAGVLGVTTAYWLSELYDCSCVVVERSEDVALNTTLRNTGLVHRPYYLDPEKKKTFARCAQVSHGLWKSLAREYHLPWKEFGTLMVATEAGQVGTLRKYATWAARNGMGEEEYELLDGAAVKRMEPEVECEGAILSRKDASTEYASLTRAVWSLAARNGAKLLSSAEVRGVKPVEKGVELSVGEGEPLTCSLMINTAGGSALEVAHMTGLAREYAALFFRGEYWRVEEGLGPRVSKNIYSVAKYPEFNFLDPHFILKADGRREVGPNAVLVSGPTTYAGLGRGFLARLAERPVSPKLRLFANGTFLRLVWDEWKSSVSKRAMCARVRRFLPSIEAGVLKQHGLAGVRSSLVGSGGFVPEALVVEGIQSLHVLNYNSPGATGAPAYSAHLVHFLESKGALSRFRDKSRTPSVWRYEVALPSPDRRAAVPA